jgi:ABC-type dipeptide/oligopeptide/nickel transport system permease subunit
MQNSGSSTQIADTGGKFSGIMKWWRNYRKSKVGVVGLAIFLTMVFIIILAPVIATHDPSLYSYLKFSPPSSEHLLGTNAVGQDTFSELLYGGRISLTIGMIGALAVTALGATIGMVAGYFGGWVDEILIRIVDMMRVIPRLPLMILLASYLGPGPETILFVVIVFGWSRPTRGVRAQVLSVKQVTFVEAARSVGGSKRHIIWNHIFPNVTGIIIANFVLEIVTVILLEAGLSFLGLGDVTAKSWGMMLHFAQVEGGFIRGAWWLWLPPGICISLLSSSCNFIGTTINDRFVLKVRRGRR